MNVANEFNLSESEAYYLDDFNHKNIYESIITDLRYLFPKTKSWDDIPENVRLRSVYDAFKTSYDNNETLLMCDATEEAFLDNNLFNCIVNKSYSNMQSVFENSLINFYEPVLKELFNQPFLEPTAREEFGGWKSEEKI